MENTYTDPNETPEMLPPPPGSFIDREELIHHVGEFALSQGYVVTIKQSKKDKVVVLGCDRGGVYRNRRKPVDETSSGQSRKRKMGSRLTNCPFELVGKKEDGLWVLTVKDGSHNHEALKDISEHPSARRFSEKEVVLIKEMTDAGLKPRQILKRLRQTNPDLLSTPKHVYNVKAKLRHGNLNVRRFKTVRPCTSVEGNTQPAMATEPSWRKRCPPRNPNLIGGRFVDSQSSASVDATQQVVSQVPLSTGEELKAAVFEAKRAFPLWQHTPVTTRQRIMFKLQELIQRDIDKLAFAIATEQGKTLKDAYSEVQRGLEIVECACGGAALQTGEFVSNMSNGIDTFSIREPLGVCAGICPFTFPAMIPLWMFHVAISCGNTYILKPSEKSPGACKILAELVLEAGLPNGVLNIIHGTNDIVNAICDDDDIEVVSFVGSDAAQLYMHGRPLANNSKCVKANAGAKNYAIVMPDANVEATLNALVAAGFGAAGQRCTTINIVVFVGGSNSWEDKLAERAKALKVNAGTEPGAALGPVISKQVREHISKLIQAIVDSGARLVLDGRQIAVSKYESGNFFGPTILSDVTEDIECAKEEILGPVLLCMQANSIDEAINLVNQNKKYCNGTSIFTGSGALARKFQIEIETRQVCINAAVPAPLPLFSLTCSELSLAGDINANGKAGVQFYTQIKTVTQQWKEFSSEGGLPPLTSNYPQSDDGLSQGLQAFEYQSGAGDYQSGDGVSEGLQSVDYQSGGELLALHSRDFSNGDGVHLALHPKDFPGGSDGESLGEHSGDISSGNGISPTIPVPDGSHWTLNF
ncbi:methylmalonate-semialdehyde dehydrogenase [acylating], mitochondrial isoform X2 [Nicotiana tabacum]|uniref:methylmalonate-semialdehyde dehydrogenase (CoA acylating) n=1 Tax=Nicotiana tabacum TaxID=4097 RepID=A0A1S3ZWY8_TOBAC|nr:PREDICTED: methylmalonate-semialdehyde dehydrogenase [acylating], mitochondrial-like isoform X2 [Nicotiana tabacum]